MLRILSLTILLASLLLTACEDKPYGHYEDDKMIGTVENVDMDHNLINVDISEWHKRDVRGGIDDYGVSISVEITDVSVIRHEDGRSEKLENIKPGQKVLVNPPRGNKSKTVTEEFILLEMTYEEKYSRLLSHLEDKLRIVVMHEGNYPEELDQRILRNMGQDTVGSWMEYDDNFFVDYKKELNIEHFPVILVFSSEELIFKTYDVEELYDFFDIDG